MLAVGQTGRVDWNGVLATVTGGCLALVGSFVAHRLADRAALARERRDWARALDERSFNARSTAYVDLLNAARQAMASATQGVHDLDQQAVLERRLSEVELLGSEDSYSAARDLLRGIQDYEIDLDPDRLTGVHGLLNEFVRAGRRDLGVAPETNTTR